MTLMHLCLLSRSSRWTMKEKVFFLDIQCIFLFFLMQLSSHVSHNYYFNSLRAELKGCYNFFVYLKKLEVEGSGYCSWRLNFCCFYFWKLKVHDFLVCLFAYIFLNGVKKVFIVLEVDL
jgi:hypothetical protein